MVMKNLLPALLLFALSGCAYVEPLVQDFNIISVPEERKIGVKIAEQISQEMRLVQDPSVNDHVRAIGQSLARELPHQDFQYQFFVVDDPTPNAFTIPGGFIYVHTGLLDFVSDDNELAGVLAHEIGHAFERHPAKGLSRQVGVEYLTSLLFKPSQSQGQFRTLALQIAKGGVLNRYSREDELRADEMGYTTLRRSGMRTDGLLRFLRKLQNLSQGRGASIPFLSTHPPTPERIARLEALEKYGYVPEPASYTASQTDQRYAAPRYSYGRTYSRSSYGRT